MTHRFRVPDDRAEFEIYRDHPILVSAWGEGVRYHAAGWTAPTLAQARAKVDDELQLQRDRVAFAMFDEARKNGTAKGERFADWRERRGM